MSFKLTIKTDNDAFSEDAGAEVARILREIAEKVENGSTGSGVLDYNGNRVGQFTLDE